ncbi:MAG: hypothetical protein ABI395_08495 [Sphingobium sp.]
MGSLLGRLERSTHVLTIAKLGNVGLSLLWGFAVTFVFVRVLPQSDFRAFLLLVAFNNFTISAEFGLTNIIYARLRRYWLELQSGAAASRDFRLEEIGVLFLFLLALIGGALLMLGLALALGIIKSGMPILFLLFFLASALNVQALLVKRGLAAIDHNLAWEALDLLRRLLSLAALVAVLSGFNLLASVVVQLVTSVLAIALAMRVLHARLHMRIGQWIAWRVGGGHVRANYLHDIGASVLLTTSEIIAYNSPYFTIAALTHEPWLLLLFDFVFKMTRAAAAAIRATIEAILPRLTRAYFAQDRGTFSALLRRALVIACGVAVCESALLIVFGQRLFTKLFADHAHIMTEELWMLCGLLLALAVICTSVYVQGALGRFALLLRQSLPYLAGSLLMVPAMLWIAGGTGRVTEGATFMALYAGLFAGVALLHIFSMRKLVRDIGSAR